MKGIFSYDSKVMQFGNRLVDLLLLNLLTILCAIPVFTIGAALTSMHTVLIRIGEDKETPVFKCYFTAFRNNFRKATIIGISYSIMALVAGMEWYLLRNSEIEFNMFARVVLIVLSVALCISASWIFILQARYENTIRNMIVNSFAIGLSHFGYTIVMILLSTVPILLVLLIPKFAPTILAFGISLPAYFQMRIYRRVFRKHEQPMDDSV